MQISHYLKVYPYEEKPDYLIIFSTKKTSKLLIPKEKWQDIKNGVLTSSEQSLLSKIGILVPDIEAEKQEMWGYIDRLNSKNHKQHLTVLLNLDCNFACKYCYEGGIKGKEFYMSDRSALELEKFIRAGFTTCKKSLVIDFHGGEPLLSLELMQTISQKAKALTEACDSSYAFNIITNGSLFTRQTAKSLVPLGLQQVQISLDGPPEIHNKNRPFKSGKGSFNTIMDNIKATCDLVKIGITGAFESHNYKQFPLLLNHLKKNDLTPDKISYIRFGPVMKNPENTLPENFSGGCVSADEPWVSEAVSFLRKKISDKEYKTEKIRPGMCMINYNDFYVINYDGGIYKCPTFIGKKDFEIGNIKTGVRNYTSVYKLYNWKNRKCAECEYLPLCFGGCRYMTYIKNGNLDEPECKKDFFDKYLGDLLRQEIENNWPGL